MEANQLAAAHRGYQYQDLVTALGLVDVVLGRFLTPTVDRKLFEQDIFDDLTTTTVSGVRHRLQIKHTSGAATPLELTNFSTKRRGTRIDHIVAAIIDDNETFPALSDQTVFRLVFTDLAPVESPLRELLQPAPCVDDSNGLWLPTVTFKFDVDALFGLRGTSYDKGALADALSRLYAMPLDKVKSAFAQLLVETSSPGYSGDLSAPGPAEELLLKRVRDEIGAGSFPNQNRPPIDFAAGLILAAQSARTGKGAVDVSSLTRRIQLRTDYGAVLAATPVDPELEVRRESLIETIVQRVSERAAKGDRVVVTGPPGQGKSWTSDQLAVALKREGWLVASHFCYLGEADHQRDDRVVLESIFGSLIARIAEEDSSLVSANLPRYAADKNALEQSLARAIRRFPAGVAIIVDGLDHVSRVISPGAASNASLLVCEALAEIELPVGVTVVVLSQPGSHLDPLAEATTIPLEGMAIGEVEELAKRTMPDFGMEVEGTFLDALYARTAGNALYATYLCREASRRDRDLFPEAAEAIQAMPDFDGTLGGYYEYLFRAVESDTWLVAERLATTPFGLTRNELKELGNGHRVDAALLALEPVIRESIGSGVRFYHESFGRYVRERLAAQPGAVPELLSNLTSWLANRGIFEDQRAFRWLIPILFEQKMHSRILEFFAADFVEQALMGSFAPRLILDNIAQGAESAAATGDWPSTVRLVQMANSAHMFAFERFELMVAYTDVQGRYVDPQILADRMLDDDKLVLSGREGLLRSSAIDALGAVAPWAICIDAYERERKSDNVHRGGDDEQQLQLSILRGRLRLAATDRSPDTFRWDQIAKMSDSIGGSAQSVFAVIEGVVGIDYITQLAEHSKRGAELLLLLAERFPEFCDEALARLETDGWPVGTMHRVLAVGLEPASLYSNVDELRHALLDSTRAALTGPSSSREGQLDEWLDLCTIAARLDPVGLSAAEVLAEGEGWYRCWIAFTINLVIAEVSPVSERSTLALEALKLLEKETNPFIGVPRACDLFSGHGTISSTIERALHLLDPSDWPAALALLARVSESTTTVGMGFTSGPLHNDELAQIVSRVSDDRSKESVRDFLLTYAENASPSVYYSEIAAHRFRLARLEIEAGDLIQARTHWTTGVELLTAYGSHKDATIYEFLESFELLTQLDIAASRLALQRLQNVTLAIEHHTDGRGTQQVHSEWWKQAAVVDPEWLIAVALPELYGNVNSTFWALQEAVEHMWTHWHSRANAEVSAAGRLAIDSTLLTTDAADLQHYHDAGLGATPEGMSMLRRLVARADERPTSTTYTNAEEILTQTEATAAEVNGVASANALPRTFRVEPVRMVRQEEDRWGGGRSSTPLATSPSWLSTPTFSQGKAGILEIIRELSKSSTSSQDSRENISDRYVNALGYRLMELSRSERSEEADQILFAIADALRFLQPDDLLACLSDGFELLGIPELTATSSVLAWTRARSDGGWKAFGGPNQLDYLTRALNADERKAREILGKEIARVSRSSDSIGPTQALIHAVGSGALPWMEGPATGAVRCWNAAFDIVSSRAPRFSQADHSEYEYVPTASGDISSDDINRYLAAVPLVKMALPGRESKRRALIAVGHLLGSSPDAVTAPLSICLLACSDPITQIALLELCIAEGFKSPQVLDLLLPTLRLLADTDLISVRTLARSILYDVPPLPLGDPSPELRRALSLGLMNERMPDPMVESAIEEFLGDRLRKTADLLPEAQDVIALRLSADLHDGAASKKIQRQLDALSSRSTLRWPDAVLAHEEAAEREMQLLAGSVRVARFLSGDPLRDSTNWEIVLANRLRTNNRYQLELERNRWPRPSFPGAPSHEDQQWDEVEASLTFKIIKDTFELFALDGTDWVCIGALEEREHVEPGRNSPGQTSLTMLGCHVDQLTPGTVPLGTGTWRDWRGREQDTNSQDSNFPLVNQLIDPSLRTGLGGTNSLLTPSSRLRSALDLRETDRMFTLANAEGDEVLRLVTWRAEYESSDYQLNYPRVQGQAVVVRHDQVELLKGRFASRLQLPLLRMLRETHSSME